MQNKQQTVFMARLLLTASKHGAEMVKKQIKIMQKMYRKFITQVSQNSFDTEVHQK